MRADRYGRLHDTARNGVPCELASRVDSANNKWPVASGQWQPVECGLCGRSVGLHESYVVRIDVFADPSVPPTSGEELAAIDFDQTIADLMEQMKHLSADDLQDDVHRRFEYRICRSCQRRFLSNPLGKPREARAGEN